MKAHLITRFDEPAVSETAPADAPSAGAGKALVHVADVAGATA